MNHPDDVNELRRAFWAETHEVENISGKDVRALTVELKGGGAKA